VWSVELPFSPADGYWKAGDQADPRPLDQSASLDSIDRVTLYDTATGAVVEAGWDAPVPIRVFPLRTVSMSEKGYERIQQGLVVLPMFTVRTARLHLIHREDLHV